jgi:archaellum component FlaC
VYDVENMEGKLDRFERDIEGMVGVGVGVCGKDREIGRLGELVEDLEYQVQTLGYRVEDFESGELEKEIERKDRIIGELDGKNLGLAEVVKRFEARVEDLESNLGGKGVELLEANVTIDVLRATLAEFETKFSEMTDAMS